MLSTMSVRGFRSSAVEACYTARALYSSVPDVNHSSVHSTSKDSVSTPEQEKHMYKYTRAHVGKAITPFSDVVISHASGTHVTTMDGRRYLDFTSGIGVVNTGHCHPKVVKAAQEQTGKIIHSQVNIFSSEIMGDLITPLLEVMPDPSLDSFIFWNSGAESVESAIKLARSVTRKNNVIVSHGGYHGRTFGTMALTTSKTVYSAGFGPTVPGVFVTPFPYERQVPAHSHSDMTSYCLESLELLFKQQTAAEDTCAIIMEPVLGEGGYVAPPPDFLKEVKRMAKERDVLFIADEVQTGFGRTGKMFAVENFDVVPDIMVMAKGLASGFPLSAIVSRKELMDKQVVGSMGGTYAGNAVACAAAKATLEVFREEKLLENVNARGEQMRTALRKMQEKYPIHDVRGLGLMIGLEFNKDVPANTAKQVTVECLNRGMMLLNTSVFETVRFIPPLTVSAGEVDEAMEIFEDALKTVFN
ncbi:hypothetical protein SARC_07106 [Sphaeroforma arctica JP610]|uniref:4-aminobutyrate aminotransferase n=1 Tax=Sphaeroforma arctica JP610 TaxID=667725 RepID=A0A0L0FV72_9EUKA|nr:hypothetical protein SARC_07106 [Sphaeroforma arctica JP610]KNC80534.1 hypothetical protein SARC_07106 [Sphaeroforma arctica JP610]|eukprot:XP_014154436.1 hypothetical protein SARC_07106 [Sphaeroforma arctica JP610]